MGGVSAEPVNPQWQPHRPISPCGRWYRGNEWGDGSHWGPLKRRGKDVLFEEAFGWNPQHPFH